MKILQEPLSDALKQTIRAGFQEHAIQEVGRDEVGEPIAFVALDKGDYIGALVAQPFWGALHIKNLWVHADQRGRGLGKQLLDKALAYRKEGDHAFAFVETLSFQALIFYQKMGFQLEHTRHGYTDDIAFHYLRKELL